MNSSGLRVPRHRGEEVRRSLVARGLLDDQREIRREGEYLVLPLKGSATALAEWGELVEREFSPASRPGPSDYRELLSVPAELRSKLPRSFDVIGDIVLVRLPDELEERRFEVGRALLSFVPGARIVGIDRGVQGPERRRRVDRIAGEGDWRTRHRENRLTLDIDVERAYFSPRLAREHDRVAAEVRAGDRVYDLCCGVGPFALSIARDGRARAVTAVDANPAAIELLRSTLHRSSFRVPVEPVEARLEEFLPRAEPRERVIFNLPLEGIKYLPSVRKVVAPGGRLYHYEVIPRTALTEGEAMIMRALGSDGSWQLRERRIVHPYSPASDLRAFVLERSGE